MSSEAEFTSLHVEQNLPGSVGQQRQLAWNEMLAFYIKYSSRFKITRAAAAFISPLFAFLANQRKAFVKNVQAKKHIINWFVLAFQRWFETTPCLCCTSISLYLSCVSICRGHCTQQGLQETLRAWSIDEESAEAVEGLLRDVHGPAEASQIGHDLQAAAVFLILAMPEPGCSLEFVDRLISLAATIYKLVVRLTHPILLKSKDASSAAEAKDAATEGGLFDLHLFSRDMVGCPSIGSVTRRKRVRELDSDGGDLDEEIPSDFEGDSDEDEGADESDGESSYETVSDDHDYGTHTSPGEEQGSETTSGGIPLPIPVGEERVAVCRALLQLRALVMLSVLRLLEWHKWCEVEAELLKHTTVLVTALQSHLGRTHELQLQLEVPLSELDVPPFQMHLRVVEGSVGGVVGYHGPGACGSTAGLATEMEWRTSGWERYSHGKLQRAVFPGCCNPACANLTGATEATLPTQLCACNQAHYCSKECKEAGWVVGGHSAECGKQ